MRTNPDLVPQKLIACAGLFLAAVCSSHAAPVTFQANMSYQAELDQFTPGVDTLSVNGSFNGWNALALTNVPGTTNYQNTIEITGTPGSTIEHKFVKNGNAYEPGANRPFVLNGSAQTVSRYWDDAWGEGPIMVELTFRVDMGPQILAGNFDPATQAVEVMGDFDSWSGGMVLTNDPAAGNSTSNIFSNTQQWPDTRAPGAPVQYKFRIQSPATYETDPNRSWPLPLTPEVLPLDCFNRACSVPIKARIQFHVDMNAQVLRDNFDTNVENVYVRGNFVGWGHPPEGLLLSHDIARPGIYTNTWERSNYIIGENFEYKFVIFDETTTYVKWEDGGNKVISFNGTEPLDSEGFRVRTVGPVYWNNVALSDLLPADTLVTFSVSMSNAVTYPPPGTPFSTGDSVFINGSFVPWWPWGAGGNPDYLMTEFPAGSQIYSFTTNIAKGSPLRLVYKYSINGSDNEGGFQADHIRFIRATNTYVMPLDIFGAREVEPEVGSLTFTPSGPGSATLSWNGRPGVHLQSRNSLTGGSWVDDWSTEGASSKVVSTAGTPVFYRLIKP